MHQRKIISSLSALILFCLAANAQPGLISGKVTDGNSGDPIPGVAVIEEGTNNSCITTNDGSYQIKVAQGKVLTFSCIGMVTQKITVGKSSVIDVVLQEDIQLLDNVVVVAYGTSTKESFTGSAETVSMKKIEDRPVTDITKMLDGQVAGVMTTSGSGQPGSGSSIIIRGFGSINASNNPLIVVDGVPFDGDLNSLNSADIENISVLKDASAGALYGARGANGVVMVTTRSGKNEDSKCSVSLNVKVGINARAIPSYETMNTQQYMEHIYNACYNDLVYTEGYLPKDAAAMTPAQISRLFLGTDDKYNPYDVNINSLYDANGKIVPGANQRYSADWVKEAQATCPVRQEYQLGIEGSHGKNNYIASASYLNDQGTLKTTSFERFTGRAGGDFKPKEWLSLGLNANFAHSKSNFLGASGTEASNVWYWAMMMAPIYPVYDLKTGEFDYGESRPAGAQNNRNCIATLYDDEYYTICDELSVRGYAGVNWKGFELTANIGADFADSYEHTKYNRESGNAEGSGRLTKESDKVLSYTFNQLLTYKNTFGGLHDVDFLLGHEFYRYTDKYIIAERTGFPFNSFEELAHGANIADADSMSDEYSIDSYLFRGNYSYADRYYFSGSVRTDGSSRFEKDHRWGVFWSLGASWRISQEKFLKNVSWINNLTLKASYGVQGNDNLGTYYAWQSTYAMYYPNASNSGAVITSLENKDVTWEKNGNLNVGVEFRFLNRLSGTIEYFERHTSDLLLARPMSISTGFDSYYANVGNLVNRGVDITIGADIISTKDWFWNVTLMGSVLRNKVLSLTENGTDIISGNYIIREGEPVNSFYLSKSAGIDPATGEQLYWAYKKDEKGNMIPGSEYVTNNTTAAAASKYIFGSRIPDLYGSISTSLKLKDFDVNMLFTYSIGGQVYDSVYKTLMEPSFTGQTYHVNALRSWTTAGQVTDVPRAMTTLTTTANDRFLVDASYFAIKNISFGYNIPEKVLSKAKIKKLRVFFSADSPYIATALKGMDPQTSFNGSTGYVYTPTSSYSFGVNLKF